MASADSMSLRQQAEDLLRARVDVRVRLSTPQVVSRRDRSLVVRSDVSGWDNVTSVIVKRSLGDDQRSFSDWASLAFLSAFDDSRTLAPLFYAGNLDERFFVMEDLGPGCSLEDLFANGNISAIVDALRRLGSSMAGLILSTYGQETAYLELREKLPATVGLGRRAEAERWLKAGDRVAQWADLLGIRIPHGYGAGCHHVASIFAEPGAFLAFSHGDPAPSNNHIAPGRACLIDFEYAGYRHALYDITGWDSLCPLPPDLLAELEGAFKNALLASPNATVPVDDGSYRAAWETMCAYRTLAMMSWMSPDLLEQDSIWVSNWTRRGALLSATSRLSQVANGAPALEPLAELGGRMFEALHARWPELGDGAPNLIEAPSDAG